MKKLLYILLFVPLTFLGQENYSLSFDNTDWIDLGNSPILTQPQQASFLVKVKMNELTGYQDIHTVFFRTSLGGQIDFGYDEEHQGFYLAVFINGDDWYKVFCSASLEYHTIVGTYDRINSEIKIYKDGVLSDSMTVPDSDLHQYNHISSLCGNNFNKTPYANVDEVIVWESILSDEIIQNFTNCSNMSEQNDLVGYWNFNEGSGDTVYDISGNGNHGTIYGATYSDDVPEQNCESSDELSIIEQLNTSFDAWNISIDLGAGWNMFGYGCPTSIGVAEGLSNHTDIIVITKDNNGNVYMPEFGFNGIGDFTPGFGYQIKITEAIEGFSLCDWYVNDIPEDNIVSLQDYIVQLEDSIELLNTTPTLPTYEVGDLAEGGIVFYVDETGQHGLVAATEDNSQMWDWGCYGIEIIGANGIEIGTGLQNTLDITSGCLTSGDIAANIALAYVSEGYNDWYLPSQNELIEMYNTIGPNGQDGNIGEFSTAGWSRFYWSSTEINHNKAFFLNFGSGSATANKYDNFSVRPIRSF